ncbi:septal ring lytic transglycosylase RlpA family protein [Nitrosomonas communis]|uniref:septal ring lytic transglycosylase RlpA family protein n=1 Tax=Nitrosomonas communis TaxID=44574 RepID=UPI0026EE4C3B|nr:septal ring lytic transglycosylase RlpA family protein [Nitrosomonas communis]MCO6426560.1 septal ring lytic transglycosylase RlpA family protein [Nitrosomonas communis]
MTKRFASILLAGVIIYLFLDSDITLAKTGYAVHYSDKFQGRKTANGEIFDQSDLTAAHNEFRYGTLVKVTNLENNYSIVVKINDRMAPHHSNIIDVTKRAAAKLGFINKGRARVSLEAIK